MSSQLIRRLRQLEVAQPEQRVWTIRRPIIGAGGEVIRVVERGQCEVPA